MVLVVGGYSGRSGLSKHNRKLVEGSRARSQLLAPVFKEIAAQGPTAAAAELNARKIRSPSGLPWNPGMVTRVRGKLKKAGSKAI
jgi:hypothetical protein